MKCLLNSAKTGWYTLHTTQDTDKQIYTFTERSKCLVKEILQAIVIVSSFCS